MAEEVVKTYWAKFGLDASNFIGGITAAQKEFLAFTGAVAGSVAVFTLAFNEYTRLVEKYGSMAQELGDLSYATGISTEELQRFHYAATLSGDNIGMVDAMLGKLTLSMGQFSDKASPAAKAFQSLSIDPTGKSTSQVFEEIAEAMQGIPDPGTKASIAIDILGRSYKDSLPYMEDYLENQEKIKDAITFSPAEQQAMEDYKRGLDDLGHSWEVFWGKALFGKPARPEGAELESIKALWMNQYGYTEEEVNAALDKYYGKAQITTSAAKAGSSRIDFTDQFQNLDETGVALQKLNGDLQDYTDAMEVARQEGDQEAFEKAALGARATQLAIDKLIASTKEYAEVTKTAVKSSATAWAASSVVGSAGSNMQLFLQREMELGNTYEDALSRWTQGSPTNATPAAGTLGSLSGGKSSAKTIGTETEATKLKTQYNTIEDQYQAHLDQMQEYYIQSEQALLTHETAETELVRIALQNMSEAWKEYYLFSAQNPTIHNVGIVVWDKKGPDWSPESNPVFMQAARIASMQSQELAYKSADFSSVQLSGKQGGGNTTIQTTVVVQGTNASLKDIEKAADKGTREAWASANGAGGLN